MLTVLKENQGREKMMVSTTVFQTVGCNPLVNHENNLVVQKNRGTERRKAKQLSCSYASLLSYRYIHTYTKTCTSPAGVKWELRNSVFSVSPPCYSPFTFMQLTMTGGKKLRQLCWMVSHGFVTNELNWASLLITLAPPHSQWRPSFLFHSQTWSSQTTASVSFHHCHYCPACVPLTQPSLLFHIWTPMHLIKAPPSNCSWDSTPLLYPRTFSQHLLVFFKL